MTQLLKDNEQGNFQIHGARRRRLRRRFASERDSSLTTTTQPASYNETRSQSPQVERLAAIGRSLTLLAHESRNALQRGQSNLDMLTLELEGQPELLRLTTRTQHALEEIHHLFGEVRSFAAPLHLERARGDVSEVWSQVWNELEVSHCDKPIRFIETVQSQNTDCDIDIFCLRQVFRNIFENAIEACADPGRIDVECIDAEFDSQPAIQICIRDNGPGIQLERIGEIFEPFFTTKRTGTGVGMAIAKQIVDAHGGWITARNASNLGAEIILCLPKSA